MRKASVRDLRYRFAEVEDLLRAGEEIQITKRRRVIGKLIPEIGAKVAKRPAYATRLRKAYGGKMMKVSGAELLADERKSR